MSIIVQLADAPIGIWDKNALTIDEHKPFEITVLFATLADEYKLYKSSFGVISDEEM